MVVPSRQALALSFVSAAAAAGLLFCVGSDPTPTGRAADGEEGGRCFANGTCGKTLACVAGYCVPADAAPDAANPVEPPSGDSGGPAEGGLDAAACGPIPPFPCGCSNKACCLVDGGVCSDLGGDVCNGPLLRCNGRSTCSADNNACCFHGALLTSGDCPSFAIHDSECANGDGGNPCSNSVVLCTMDADCTLVDAGVCRPARLAGTSQILGVCRK